MTNDYSWDSVRDELALVQGLRLKPIIITIVQHIITSAMSL